MGRVFRSRNKINHPPVPKASRIADFVTRIPNRRPIVALLAFGCLRLLIRPANSRQDVCTPSKSDQWPLLAACISPHGECSSSARPSATGFLLPLRERWLFVLFSPLYRTFLHFLMFRVRCLYFCGQTSILKYRHYSVEWDFRWSTFLINII